MRILIESASGRILLKMSAAIDASRRGDIYIVAGCLRHFLHTLKPCGLIDIPTKAINEWEINVEEPTPLWASGSELAARRLIEALLLHHTSYSVANKRNIIPWHTISIPAKQ